MDKKQFKKALKAKLVQEGISQDFINKHLIIVV